MTVKLLKAVFKVTVLPKKMSHVHYMDELIREYLLYRGFSGTLKAFDSELKVDKDKSFRVSKYICSS